MSGKRHRRFSGFQVFFHWVVAVPYLALLSTGGLLILSRLGLLRWIPASALGAVHKWVGIVLVFLLVQLFVMAIVGGQLGSILKDLAEWCRFRARDLLWLLMVPLNILFPRHIHLPAVGRYNAGQKLHGVFIVCGISTFAITGLLILSRPSDIRPWIVHSWLFFGALAFLLLHLFLGLINPPTRRALPGIFKGHVPLEYIEEHHPLVLTPTPLRRRPHAVVSLVAVLFTTLVVVAGASALVWHYGPQRSRQKIAEVAKLEHPMISPGPLARSHAEDPRTANCETCHVSLKPPSSSACLACHSEIATVLQNSIGFHGQLKGECRTCHADHRGFDADLRGLNMVAFNHQQARFKLAGQHESLQCDQCHIEHSGKPGQRRFIGLQFASCSDCHTSPHEAIAALDCQKCHIEQGWKGRNLIFDHQRDTDFPLVGRHAAVECSKCHAPSRATSNPKIVLASAASTDASVKFRLTGVGSACADCHADPHRGQFEPKGCASCHSPFGWKGKSLLFEHNRDASFKIDAIHRKLECASCHTKLGDVTAYRGLSSSCEQCHQPISQAMAGKFQNETMSPDPHNGRVQCADCHSPNVATPASPDFAQACANCHNPRYSSLFFDWQKSLNERVTAAQRVIIALKTMDPQHADALAARLAEARQAGLHNLATAIRILDGITGENAPAPEQRGH